MQTEVSHLNIQEQIVIKTFLHRIEAEMGDQLLAVYLFGSRARGDAQPDSDIDLAVLLKESTPEIRKAIHYLAADVWLENGLFISTRVWSQSHWQRHAEIQSRLYRNIQREGIDLLSALGE